MTTENIINGFDFSKLPIRIEYVGEAVDQDIDHAWDHFLWNVTVSYQNGFWTFPYKTGKGLVNKGKPRKPTNADVMYSVLMDAEADSMSFNDWCDNYGYSNDSMKAFKTYQTCCEYSVFIRKAFTREQIAEMRKALEDY